MVQWEYKLDSVYANVGAIEKLLAERGIDGWELVSVNRIRDGATYMLIWKRMK